MNQERVKFFFWSFSESKYLNQFFSFGPLDFTFFFLPSRKQNVGVAGIRFSLSLSQASGRIRHTKTNEERFFHQIIAS